MHSRTLRLHATLAGSASLLLSTAALATTYPVGATRQYKSPCELAGMVSLAGGDIVEVDPGTYTEACQLKASGSAGNPITMRGVAGMPRPVMDGTGMNVNGSGSTPRALFQFTGASYWVLEHMEMQNATNDSNNGAGFRITAGGHDITVRDCSIHDNQDGAQSDGPVTLLIDSCDIYKNGAGDGQSHNLYMIGDYVRVIGSHIHDSVGGQNVKMRVHYVELFYNLIENAGNYEIDLIQSANTQSPNANAVMIGNVLVRNPNADNHGQTILFGSDNPGEAGRMGSFYAINNTFVLTLDKNRLLHINNPDTSTQAYFYDNIFHTTVPGAAIGYDAATEALISGSNNWVTTGLGAPASLSGTVAGADPGFVSASDFHLSASSPAKDQGIAAPMASDGSGASFDATPSSEYAAGLGVTPRASDGALDLGAFEVAGSGGSGTGGAGQGGQSQGQGGSGEAGTTSAGGAGPGAGGAGPGAGGNATAGSNGQGGSTSAGGASQGAGGKASGGSGQAGSPGAGGKASGGSGQVGAGGAAAGGKGGGASGKAGSTSAGGASSVGQGGASAGASSTPAATDDGSSGDSGGCSVGVAERPAYLGALFALAAAALFRGRSRTKSRSESE